MARRTPPPRLRPVDHGLVLSCALIFYGQMVAFGANNRLLATSAAILELVFALSCAVAFIGEARLVRAWRIAMPAVLLLAGAAWLNLADYLKAPRSDATLIETVKLLGAGSFCLATAWLCLSRDRMRYLLITLVSGALIYAILCMAVRETGTVWGVVQPLNTTRFSGTLLNSNAMACVFAMLALLSLGLLLMSIERRGAKFNGRLMVLCLTSSMTFLACAGGCLLTASRAGAAFLGLGAISLIVVTLLGWRGRRRDRGIVGLVAFVILAVATTAGAAALLNRGLDVSGGVSSRKSTVDLVWKGVLAEPVFGLGANAVPQLIEGGLTPENVDAIWNVRAAHFALLELAVDGGLPYAGLVLAAAVAVGWQILARTGGWGRQRAMRYALMVALAVVLACSFIDIALNVPAVASLTAMLLGMLWGRAIAPAATLGTASASD